MQLISKHKQSNTSFKMVSKDIWGNWLLWKFYIKSVKTLHQLPKWMRNPDNLIEKISSVFDSNNPEKFELTVPAEISKNYNEAFDRMKVDMRGLHAGERERFTYKTTLFLLFSIRLACIVTAFHGNLPATLMIRKGSIKNVMCLLLAIRKC